MKKSLIALAVAGAFAAPAMAATSNVDVYGLMHFAIEDTNVNGQDLQVTDRVSRIGFKGSEDLGGGLKAIWQIEQQINATNSANTTVTTSTATITTSGGHSYTHNHTASVGNGAFGGAGLRNTFIGLSGSFGTVLMGRHDTPYKLGTLSLDPFVDTMADYNAMPDGVALVNATHDYRSPQAIAYISPTWSGFHFAVAAIATNTAANLNNNDTFDAVSATAVYSNGPLFASLSYQDVNVLGANDTATKLGLGYTFGDAKVGFIYEDVEKTEANWLINGVYNMGPIALKAEYGRSNPDAAGAPTKNAYALGVDYNLSKRTTAYALYTRGDDKVASSVSGYAIGLKHSF